MALTVTANPFLTPAPAAEDQQPKLADTIKNVFQQKEALRVKTLDKKFDRFNPFIIGGDALTMATFAFQGLQIVAPNVSQYAAVSAANMTCSILAGVINLGVARACLKEGIQALHNGDRLLGLRLLIDAGALTAISAVMILNGLSTKISALAPIGAFFHAHDWVLPVLFLIISIPVICEISRRINLIYNKKDLASTLDLKKIEEFLNQTNVDGACRHLLEKLQIHNITGLNQKELFEKVSNAMEHLQAEMGGEAALSIFNLLSKLQEKNYEASVKALQEAKKEIQSWNNVQYIRLFQQFLYVLAFGVSMSLLTLKIPPSSVAAISATQQFAMTGANAIPLYMDSTMPFKRNPPMVIPKVETTA